MGRSCIRWIHFLPHQRLRWWPSSSGAVILRTGEWSHYNLLNNGSWDVVQQFSTLPDSFHGHSIETPGTCLAVSPWCCLLSGAVLVDLGEMSINLGYQGGFLQARWPNWVGTNQWNNQPVFWYQLTVIWNMHCWQSLYLGKVDSFCEIVGVFCLKFWLLCLYAYIHSMPNQHKQNVAVGGYLLS